MAIKAFLPDEEIPSDGVKLYIPEEDKERIERLTKRLEEGTSEKKLSLVYESIILLSESVLGIRDILSEIKANEKNLLIEDKINSIEESLKEIKNTSFSVDAKPIFEKIDELKSMADSLAGTEERIREIMSGYLTIRDAEEMTGYLKEIKTRMEFKQLHDAKLEKAIKSVISKFSKIDKNLSELKFYLSNMHEMEQLNRMLSGTRANLTKLKPSALPQWASRQKKKIMDDAKNVMNETTDIVIVKMLGEYKRLDATQIVAGMHISPALVRNRLKELKKSGKILRKREGKFVFYSLK